MEYRKLGRTGLRASVIGFGAEWIGKMEQAEVNAMAARGAAAGVNIVDCWMSDPAVRSALGEALEPTRDQWIIQGHIGSTWQDGQYVRTRELDQVRPAFEDLLARLHTDHVELGMIHYVDACDGIEPVRARLYAKAEQTETALTVMKGYAGGRLLSADASPFGVALTPVQCIHYALTRPAVASVMVGVETVEQLEEALAYGDATAAERDYASVLAAAPKHAYLGQCTYCGHCAPCAVGINIALSSKFADLAEMAGEVPASVAAHYKAMDVTAGACIACGDCEPRCPFDVPIIERMEKTEELFGC